MSPPAEVGWGIVGCGWVARDHLLPGLVATPGARLVGACDRDAVAAARLAARHRDAGHGDVLATADLDALLSRPGVDAVYVATPNSAHRPVVAAAAARGVPVLCEKPLAADVADAEAIVAACTGLLAGTAFDQRFHPAHRRIAELVAAGELGTVTAVRIVYACWLPPDWSPYSSLPEQLGSVTPRSGHPTPAAVTDLPRHDNWRVDPARAGGGALVDLAPHGIDLVGALLGGDDLERLDVVLQRRVHAYPVDDGAVLAGRTAAGVVFSGHVAFNTPDALPRRRLEVVGTRAQLVAENTMGQTAGGRLTLTDATGAVADVPFDTATSPFAGQLAAFSAAVAGSAGPAGSAGAAGPAGPAAWPWPLGRDLRLHRLLHEAIERS